MYVSNPPHFDIFYRESPPLLHLTAAVGGSVGCRGVVAHRGPYRAPGDPVVRGGLAPAFPRFHTRTRTMATGIKVHVAGNVFEGTVFAIDPVTKSIVLSE